MAEYPIYWRMFMDWYISYMLITLRQGWLTPQQLTANYRYNHIVLLDRSTVLRYVPQVRIRNWKHTSRNAIIWSHRVIVMTANVNYYNLVPSSEYENLLHGWWLQYDIGVNFDNKLSEWGGMQMPNLEFIESNISAMWLKNPDPGFIESKIQPCGWAEAFTDPPQVDTRYPHNYQTCLNDPGKERACQVCTNL